MLSPGGVMKSHQEMVKEFMISFGQEAPDSFNPESFPHELRSSLIMEESLEFCQAAAEKDYVGIIDAICDLLYVTYGAAIALGIDINPFFEEVHRSNMSKLDPETGMPTYRNDGKVIKPETYSPADIKGLMLRIYGMPIAKTLSI
jgi:predicted HAD superfamily Cof-like phosphohydrolase